MNTKQTEALKLALEALELYQNKMSVQMFDDAVKTIREALAEQPAQGCEFCSHPLYAGTKCKNCGREQPAQQEQVRVPVTDNTYNYAKSLAEAIFKQHFASDEHYASGRIVWGVNDTVIGILTQIDNMVADMVRRPAQQQEPEYKGWYCTHCQRGVDGSEVTYHEQHTVCGRVITDDLPPSWDSFFGNAERPAQQQVFPACRGMNCGCTDGTSHSPECQAEHAAAIAGGVFVKTARQQEPLTNAQIIKLWIDAPNDTIDLMAFKAVVRFAEAAHNIKEKNT